MIDRKNRYGRTAARIHDADGLARRPSSATIDIHAHIVVPQAAKLAQPHVDISRIPLAHFADAATKEINAQQEKDVGEVMTTIDRRLFDLDKMGIDIQVVAPAPGQCYYSIDPKIAEAAHRLANDGVVEYCSRKPDRFVGLGVVTLQEPEIAVRELDYIMNDLKLKGVEILTNVDGQELSDPKFRPFFARAEQLGAFIMMHPNGFTHGERLTHFYFNNVLGNPLETTLALHNLIFSGTLARFPDLKLMAVHGGGYLPGYSGRIDHAWGARQDCHGELPLPPTTYLRQVYLDTVVFTYHQLAYLIDVFGPDRIVMGTDYPFDMAEYNPIGHVAGVHGMDEATLAQIAGGNAARVLGLDVVDQGMDQTLLVTSAVPETADNICTRRSSPFNPNNCQYYSQIKYNITDVIYRTEMRVVEVRAAAAAVKMQRPFLSSTADHVILGDVSAPAL